MQGGDLRDSTVLLSAIFVLFVSLIYTLELNLRHFEVSPCVYGSHIMHALTMFSAHALRDERGYARTCT
jgi:hypothetical protein